jgi:outer membrane murein-binding lipoprotein Lpp
MTLLQLPKVIEAVNELGKEIQTLKAKVEALEQQIQLAKTVKESSTNANKGKKQ